MMMRERRQYLLPSNAISLLLLLLLLCTVTPSRAFTSPGWWWPNTRSTAAAATRLQATSPQKTPSTSKSPSKRRILLSRNEPYFHIDQANIAFGATANLVTQLEEQSPNPELIAEWLSDERGLALSIWDESMMKEKGDSMYQLQTMNLQFVTIKLAPTVDMKMKTSYVNQDPSLPVFQLQSVGFDPNIQVLPGISMTAEQLGIEIVVSGELRPSKDGMGVTGRVAFETSGKLPPPLRILPEQVLKMTTDAIDQTIVDFAIQSFQKGATAKYRAFRQKKLLQQQASNPNPPQ